jgi:disulfide bond formation protein DsbB
MFSHNQLLTVNNLTLFILLVSATATLGSLYYQFFGDPVSNIQAGNFFMPNNGYTPCLLCWWQRIWMYPITLISVIALLNKDRLFAWYTLALSVIGSCFAAYHYFIQKVSVGTTLSCSLDNPCNATEVNYLGFITIPFLALTAFVLTAIVSSLLLSKKSV